MMQTKTIIAGTVMGLALALGGCATVPDESGGECKRDAGQNFIGRTASTEIGQELLRATGAKQLRWGPPGAAMTMDFRPDRVTVMYDAAMKITGVNCG